MSCGKCGKRTNCKEICKEVEALLPKPQGGNNSRKIKFYDPSVLEDMANRRAFGYWGLAGKKKTYHEQ